MRTATTTRTRERFSLIQSVARPRVEMNSSGPFRSFRVYLIFLPTRFLSRSSFDQFPRVRLHACGILLRQSRSPDNLERRLPGSEIPGRMRIGIVHQPGARFHRHSRDVAVRERMSLAGGDLLRAVISRSTPFFLASVASSSERRPGWARMLTFARMAASGAISRGGAGGVL